MRRGNWLFMLLWAGAAQAETPPLVSSALSLDVYAATDTRVMRLQNVIGDSRADLLMVRPLGATQPATLTFWERRDRVGRRDYVSGLPEAARAGYGSPVLLELGTPVVDVQGLFIPGGVTGAARDLVALVGGDTPSLNLLRNRGPDTTPRFERLGALEIPGATRLHYPVLVPFPPGSPGFVNLPLAVGTDDGSVAVVRFGSTGEASVLMNALPHPGGAQDVLYLTNLPQIPVALLTVGAGEPWLWLPDGQAWSGAPVVLPGKPAANARVGLLGEFDGAVGLELVLAFDDGSVWRWNAAPPLPGGPPARWDTPAQVSSGIVTVDLVEMLTGPEGAPVPTLVVAGTPESRVFLAAVGSPDQPFGDVVQPLPAAQTAFGDFGLGLLLLANVGGGISVFERAGAVNDETPFSVDFASAEPIAVAPQRGGGGVFATTVQSPVPSTVRYGVAIAWQEVPGGAFLGAGVRRLNTIRPGDVFPQLIGEFPSGSRQEVFAAVFNSTPPTRINAIRLVEVNEEQIDSSFPGVVPAPVREPAPERTAFLLPPECLPDRTDASARVCIATCYNAAVLPPSLTSPPATPGKASTQFLADGDLALLRRFRDAVLGASAKGRDYDAMYYQLSPAIYQALLRRPEVFLDFVAARDAWLPAIRSLVDGDGSHLIDEAMLERLDTLAQFMVLDSDPMLAQTLADEYRRLDPRTLEGASMSALRERFEALPTRAVFASGFEPAAP